MEARSEPGSMDLGKSHFPISVSSFLVSNFDFDFSDVLSRGKLCTVF
jgi:hypothetical protein